MEAPKRTVTMEQIESRIVGEQIILDGTLTICLLTLVNGFRVVGTSACVDPEKYDADIGSGLARKDAVRQIWPLEGYALANRLLFERDAETAARIDTLAAEANGVRVGCRVVAIAEDDLEEAKRMIREADQSSPGTLTRALALLTPEVSPMVLLGGGEPTEGPFDGFLDRSIDEIVPDLEMQGLPDLAKILAAESAGKTRKGLVRAIGAEVAGRGSGEE